MKLCSNCNSEHEREGRYCLVCHAAYMREWRKTHPMNEGQRFRDNARSHAGVAKKRGQIVQKPCCVCSASDSEMHHPDHEMPLLVVWLCRECHLTWHAFWRFTSLRTWNNWLADRRENVSRETNDSSELRAAYALQPHARRFLLPREPGKPPVDPDAEQLARDVLECARVG